MTTGEMAEKWRALPTRPWWFPLRLYSLAFGRGYRLGYDAAMAPFLAPDAPREFYDGLIFEDEDGDGEVDTCQRQIDEEGG